MWMTFPEIVLMHSLYSTVLSTRSGGTLTLKLIMSGPWSILNKLCLQDERINKNYGCPEVGTEGRGLDEAWKWWQQGMESLTLKRTKDSGAQREVVPLLGELEDLWIGETLLLFGLSFPSIKWGHFCRKVVLCNLYFLFYFILHLFLL